ncbi:MAG TPA: EAL domain-containing protein [Arcobacter sp.]|nr:EAL domain-containing protein [Arcobacter sp.]
MLIFKYLIYIIFLYVILLLGTLSFIFKPIKDEIISAKTTINSIYINNFELKVKKQILNNNYDSLVDEMIQLKETNILNNIEVKYLKYYITVESLLKHSDNIKTKDWVLNDVSIDSRFGNIKKYSDTIYVFTPDEDYEKEEYIDIKFQALNDTNMQNSISSIRFILPKIEFLQNEEKSNKAKEYLKSILNLQDIYKEKFFYLDNGDNFASIKYTINNNAAFKKIYETLVTLLIYFTILYFLIVFLILSSNYVLMQTMIVKYLKELEAYINDVLDNKFYKFNEKKLKHKNIIKIAKSISKISKKTSSIINELNVNKSTLELQLSTDNLTKFPNSKIFENDLKSLFLTDIKSYISLVKLETLKNFVKNNSQKDTDQLILSFANILKTTIEKVHGSHSTIYRSYGSEFIIISKFADFKLINTILSDITDNINILREDFKLDEKIIFSTSIPFDHYSTTQRILEKLEKVHEERIVTLDTFYIEKPDEANEKDLQLEKVVTSIIKNDAFSLSYKFDTYLFMEENILIMKEVSANLLSTDGSVIPIGTFIAVAEHKQLAIDFDKQLIIKVFKFINKNNIDYILAINISISSINDDSFINWLEAKLLYDYKDVINNIVFSVTTFAAKNNFDTFVKFSNSVKKFNGKILLKRFSYNDLKLEELESLNLDYIRVHKDYTTNIDEKRKVVLKNIVNFSVIHDIHILGDLVSNQSDYDILKGLRFYGTSK